MHIPVLELAKPDNGVFESLKKQWLAQAEKYEPEREEYSSPYMEHAEDIVRNRTTPDYGIACVKSDAEGYLALFHVNRARLPRTTGYTLRVLWVLPSPRFDFAPIEPQEQAELAAGIIFGSMELAQTTMRSDQVKIQLQNVGDRKFVTAMALALPFTEAGIRVETGGNWLHISGHHQRGVS